MTKRTKEEIDAWLNNLYLKCIQNKIPHSQREFEVISRIDDFLKSWSRDPISEKEYAIQWMRDRCKQGSDLIPMPIFAFYYDAEFWEVTIFRAYGAETIDPIISLTNMPHALITYLSNTNNYLDIELYQSHWANSIDLIQGLSDIKALPDHMLHNNLIAKNLLFSGVENLNATTSALLHPTPNSQSIMNIRMALEMFIKSYILLHENPTATQEKLNKRAINIGHNLKKGLNVIKTISPNIIKPQDSDILDLFSEKIEERYIPQSIETNEIASCYNLALRIGAMVTRSITDRNILNQ